MAEEPSTPGLNQLIVTEETNTPSTPTPAASATPSTNPMTPDLTVLFMEAYECAKNNHNWKKVSTAISSHPDWLTRVPQGLFHRLKKVKVN